MPPLDVLPHEVIEEIAVHACRSPFLGPPAALPGLLVLSRRTHGALAVQFNPGLHARIFRDKFDTLAPARRFAAAGQPLTAANYALELRCRFITLRRIRRVAGANTNAVCSEEDERADFWTIFLMFLESDGKNYDQLVRWANVTSYMRIFIRDQLVPSQRPGFPLESTLRSLGLWVMWFLTEIHAVVAEMRPDVAQIQAMLRPWVLAAFKYDALFAPYNYYHLPAPSPHAVPAVSADHELLLTPQFLADLELRDRTELVMHMARRIRLAPPPASLAAIMALMVRLERNGPIPSRAVPVQPPDPGPFVSTISPHHPGLTIYPRTRFPSFQGPGSTEFDGRPNAHGSAKWDSEWLRIVSCGNPQAAVPPAISQQPKFRPGDLAGVWEGRFVFISFDDFRDMLTGSVHAAQNGQLAQQPQVWRIREHHCIDRRRRIGSCSDPRDYVRAEPLPVGNSLDAYIPANAEFIQHGEVLPPGVPISAISNRRLEIRIPNPSSTNGFNTYSYVTMDGSDEFNDIPGYVPIPTYYMDMYSDAEPSAARPLRQEDGGDDEWIETITDTIITGEGHSSWGRFHLRGRIRHWDGMITVVKDYAGPNTEGRGRWLYKGYVVAGANWVGRWRDTFTAEHLVGYEGVFSVSRRV